MKLLHHPLGAALGIVADRLFGEPPVRPHPVAILGQALLRVEDFLYADRRGPGIAHAAAGVGLGLAAGRLVPSTALATYVAVAGRALGEAARDVERSLRAGDLARARALLPALVGRDPSTLDQADICRAVVESVAENTVDAVIAPAVWGAAAGAPAVLAYRAVNTMDAMVGHRSPRYLRYGWAAARLDDAANYLPARITAGLVAACRPRAAPAVLRVVRRDAPAHPSPNSGVAEAAFAAALGLRLGGRNVYAGRVDVRPTLGDGRPPGVQDIASAVRLSRDVSLLLAALLTVPTLLDLLVWRRRPR